MSRSHRRTEKSSTRHQHKNRRPTKRQHRLLLETLEDRRLLAAEVWVNDNWFEVANGGGTPGVVDNGDTVDNRNDAGAPAVTVTYGTNAFPTIAAGVTAVDSGGIVNVLAGNYPTGANLNKPVTLKGQQAGVDARDGRPGALETVITGGGLGIFTLNATDITFDGFTFSNLKGRTIDTYYNADDFTMRNCILQGSSIDPGYNTGAIQFGGGLTLHANGLLFEQNLVTADNGQLFYMGHSMDNGTFRNNKFNGDSVSFGPFGNRTGWLIEGNLFDGNVPGHGPYWGFGFNANLGDVVIRNNTATQMSVGIGQISVVGGSITANTFTDNSYAAFQLWGGEWGSVVSSNVQIENNTITYNGTACTGFADASHGIRLRPGTPGIDASTIHIHENSFTDLGVGTCGEAWAIRNQGDPTTTLDATLNWWGTDDPNTIRARLYGPVNFSPFLLTGTDTGDPGFQGDLTQQGVAGPTADGIDDTYRIVLNGSNVEFWLNGALQSSQPLAGMTNIEVTGSTDNDTLIIDMSGGNPVPTGGVVFDGGEALGDNDKLAVKGNGAASTAVYTPDASTPGKGTILLDGTRLVSFSNLEPVDISGMATVTVASPANPANTLSLAPGFDVATGLIPAIVVSGDTGLGATLIEPAHLFNNINVVLDTRATTGTGVNTITVATAIAAGHNNRNLTLKTNASGNVVVNAALAVSTTNGTVNVQSPLVDLYDNITAKPSAGITGTATTVNVKNNTAQIQDGINVAAAGATVNVAAGTYDEDVTMTPLGIPAKTGLQLIGAGAATTTIRGVLGGANETILIGQNQVLDGFTITRATGSGENNLGLVVTTGLTGSIIRNNVFTGNRTAIYLNGGNSQATITRNVIDNNRTGIILPDGSGYGAYQITENAITNNKTFGILFNAATSVNSGLTITGNNISGNYAVQLENDSGSPVNASGNWWGTPLPVVTAAQINGTLPSVFDYPGPAVPPGAPYPYAITGSSATLVDYTPTLNSAADTDLPTPGFQGDFSTLNVDGGSPQTGAVGRITEAIGLLPAAGGTINVLAGTYAENVDASALATTKAVAFAPGGSGNSDQVTIDGDLTLNSGDTLLVDLAGATAGSEYDQWVINETGTPPDGTVTLGGATLTLNLTYAPAAGAVYTIIDNDDTDAVDGTFGNVASNGGTITATYNSTPYTFRVFYTGGDGNDVVLVENSASPTVTYAEDTAWSGLPPGTVVDGNLATPEFETAVIGVNAFTTIQAAVNAVATGGTVHVNVGTYPENVDITKSLTMLGPQANVEPVSGGRPTGEATVTGSDAYPFVIRANDVTVNGMAIGGAFSYGVQIRCVDNPVDPDSVDNVTVSYTYLRSTRTGSWTAIVFGEDWDGSLPRTGTGTVSDLVLSHNLIEMPAGGNRAISAASLFDFMTYNGITITDNVLKGPGSAVTSFAFFCGVLPAKFEMNDLVFDRNDVDSFRTAVNCVNIYGASFQENTFSDVRFGLYVNVHGTDTEPALINDNVFEDVLTGTAVDLAGDYYGDGDEYVEISGNVFNYNEVVYSTLYPAVWLDPGVDAATVHVTNNQFLDGGANATPAAAFQNESGTGIVDAENNWWGTDIEAEITAQIDGAGVLVDYIPWLDLNCNLVLVDDDWVTKSDGEQVTIGNVTYIIGLNAFDTIQAGITAVDPNGTVQVFAGSYVGGADTAMGGKNLTLVAGAGPGQVIADGDLTLNTGDTLPFDLAGTTPGSEYDQWVINETGTPPDGTVTLSGATLALNLTYAPVYEQTFVLIDNDDTDPVVGTFGNAPNNGDPITASFGGSSYTFRVFYTGGDGNDVVLYLPNYPPTATFGNNGPVNEGSTATVAFSNEADPDSAPPFHYAYDFDNDGTFEVGDGTFSGSPANASATIPASYLADGPGTRTVRGRIIDWADGFTDYTTIVAINNVAPTAVFVGGAVVYDNDFESGAGTAWSSPITDVTPLGGRRFLGQFGSQTVSLNLDGLPGHDQLTLSFDLFAIRSWGGNALNYGVDVFDISVSGGPTLLHSTFSNYPQLPEYARQSYPGSYPGGDYPAFTGAVETTSLGYFSEGWAADSVYFLSYSFPHSGSSVQVDFSFLSPAQGLADESWGLDNVLVSVASVQSVTFSDQFDPSPTDTQAGLHYAYDLDGNGTFDDGAGDGSYGGSLTAPSYALPFSTPGVYTVHGRILDDDGGSSDYWTTVTIPGAPEIDVQLGGVSLPDDTGSVDFGTTIQGTPVDRVLTISNTGSDSLNLSSLTLPAGFALVGAFPATVAAGGSANFTVRLTATAAGTYSGPLSFQNNDSDENPYVLTLSGQVLAPASKAILDDGDTGFTAGGFTLYSSSKGYLGDVRFALPGTGSKVAQWQFDLASLGMINGLYRVSTLWYVESSRTTNATYKLYDGTSGGTLRGTAVVNQQVVPRADVVDAGRNWQDLGYLTTTGGVLTVTLSDAVSNGAVVADAIRIERFDNPEIEVSLDGTGSILADGSGAVNFGSVFVGSTAQVTLRVKNVGVGTLTLTNPPAVGGQFTLVSGFGSTSLGPNDGAAGGTDETTFIVGMDTSAAGSKSGTLSFDNGDADENPFNLTLQGAVSSVKIIDDGDAGYSENAAWSPYSGGYQNDLRFSAANAGKTATWTFAGLPPGTYRISATWVQHTNRANNAPYQINGGGAIPRNQKLAPSDPSFTRVQDPVSGKWFADLAVGYGLSGGGTLTVTLTDVGANGYVIADAIRVERTSALTAAGDAAGALASVVAGQPLTVADVQPLLAAATAYWSASDPAAAARLANVELVVAPLTGQLLGLASAVTQTVWIDQDGAGRGWSVIRDRSSEVRGRRSEVGGRRSEVSGPWSVVSGCDLLSVLEHELGHVLGYDHSEDGLMSPVLSASPLRASSSIVHLSSLIPPPSSLTAHPSYRLDAVFADLGDDSAWQDCSEAGTSQLLASQNTDLLAASAVKSGLEATQAEVPRRDRLQRYERELDDWFAELAAEEASQ